MIDNKKIEEIMKALRIPRQLAMEIYMFNPETDNDVKVMDDEPTDEEKLDKWRRERTGQKTG